MIEDRYINNGPEDGEATVSPAEDLKPTDANTPSEVAQLYEGAREVETSEELDGADRRHDTGDTVDLPGFKFLTSLLKATPFSDFLHYKAVTCCTHKTRQGRIKKYSDDHPKLTAFCTFADLLLRCVAVIMILAAIGAIIGATIYRTFYSEVAVPPTAAESLGVHERPHLFATHLGGAA